jgi:hypothetical protein
VGASPAVTVMSGAASVCGFTSVSGTEGAVDTGSGSAGGLAGLGGSPLAWRAGTGLAVPLRFVEGPLRPVGLLGRDGWMLFKFQSGARLVGSLRFLLCAGDFSTSCSLSSGEGAFADN